MASRTNNLDWGAVRAALEEDWRCDPELRAEFRNDFDSYFAFRKASISGRTSIIRDRIVRGGDQAHP